jgi:hypothetical protein
VGPWRAPIIYDYGTGGNVYYQGDTVYVQGAPYASAQVYSEEALQIADAGALALAAQKPPAEDQQNAEEEWLPLGVFALADENDGDPIMYLQLAVNKQGIISGSYYNSVTDQSLPIQGSVDRESQRAAWTVGDNSTTVMETGIQNLTQDETQVLIHFGDDRTQTWLLVRIDQPEEGATQEGTPEGNQPAAPE